MHTTKPSIQSQRIEMVDALRGFVVMAILLLHNVEHFIFSVYPTESPAWLEVIDDGVFNAAFALFGGKAYAIFALFFGFTFSVQYANQRSQGKDFGYRFLWRLVGLTLLATLNAAFFPGGDVLMLYAIKLSIINTKETSITPEGVMLAVLSHKMSIWKDYLPSSMGILIFIPTDTLLKSMILLCFTI